MAPETADEAALGEAASSAPQRYRCTSPPGPGATASDVIVYRIAANSSGGQATVQIKSGPTHNAAADQVRFSGAMTVTSSPAGFDAQKGGVRLSIQRSPNGGPVLPGTLSGVGSHGAVALTCWHDGFVPAFHYDPSCGHCLDAAGKTGYNAWPVPMVRELGNGECVDLTGALLNEEDYGYPRLTNWKLAGANLQDAALLFANLTNADLRGVDFEQISIGYAEIKGRIDRFSRPHPVCLVSGNDVDCHQ
jgi:hypothetical protein